MLSRRRDRADAGREQRGGLSGALSPEDRGRLAAVVGLVRWVLHLPGCQSLKAKRRVVHGLRDRLQSRFRVSAAETDFQDMHQRCELCAAVVTSDRRLAESILSRLDQLVEADPRAQVIERETAFL